VTDLAPGAGRVAAPASVPHAANASGRQVRCRRGEAIIDPRPGDIVLVHGRGPLGYLIRLVQRIRYRTKQDRGFTYWSHVALVVTSLGHLIEVAHTGVVVCRIEKYRNHDYVYVGLDLSASERSAAVRFAYSCVRQRYGTFSAALLVLAILSGDRFRVRDRGQQGCGSLVVRALQRAGMKFERSPAETLPADLAKRFSISSD